MMKSSGAQRIADYFMFIALIVLAVIWILPVYLILINTFKNYGEMMSNLFKLPVNFSLKYYIETWVYFKFVFLFKNTLIYTVFTVVVVVIVTSLAAYKLARVNTRYSRLIMLYFILPMMIPFHSYMITLVKFARTLYMTGNIYGLIIIYCGLFAPLAVFLYTNFIRTIPVEIDECAKIDGASGFGIYYYLIFPILKPITITIIVIDALAAWNDFFVLLIVLGSQQKYINIQNALYIRFSAQSSDWEHALPGIVIASIPALIFFIFMQKHIMAGAVSGSIKS